MRKFFSKRPSPAMIVAIVALVAAGTGGAIAQTTKKKVEYKGLSKDARLKVLPFSKTIAGGGCNPTAAGTFTDCATVNVTGSTGFPRKYYVDFDGVFDNATPNPAAPAPPATAPANVARGDCRLELDDAPIAGAQIRVQTGNHQANHGDGYGMNIITAPAGGNHAISIACNETENDLRVQQFQLSAFQVR